MIPAQPHNTLDFQFIDQIAKTKNLDDLTHALADAAQRLGCIGFFATVQCSRPIVEPVRLSFSSKEGWSHRYRDQVLALVDPIWAKSLHAPVIFAWQVNTNRSDDAHRFWDHCAQMGFNQGYSVCSSQDPHWRLAISFAQDDADKRNLSESAGQSAALQVLSIAVQHALIQSIMPTVVNEGLPKISTRELHCLKWAARGNTASEISALMDISEATVVFHLNNLIRKLKVNNRTQAIAVGISLGLTD